MTLFCYLALIPVIAAQVVAAMALVRRVTVMLENAVSDPFAMLSDSGSGSPVVEVTTSSLERFSSGFAMSAAASFGVLALFAGTWLIPPYRNRSHRVLIWSVAAQGALVLWSLIPAITGSAAFGAATVGTVATLLYGLPALWLARHPVVVAWSVRFEPPPPPLPQSTPGGE